MALFTTRGGKFAVDFQRISGVKRTQSEPNMDPKKIYYATTKC